MDLKIKPCKRLKGTIYISGSKNATLPLMVLSLLTNEAIILNNVPHISDVLIMMHLLKEVGIKIIYDKDKHQMCLQKEKLLDYITLNEDVTKIRASYYLMGALIANNINFTTNYPGGCTFSTRPIDYHLDAFRKIGYQIIGDKKLQFIKKQDISDDLLFTLKKPSVGTTINILITNVLRKGKTIIENPSLEPEVLSVITFFKKMQAKIILINKQIHIEGVEHLIGLTSTIISDRIEAGSYLLLGCAIKSKLQIKKAPINQLTSVFDIIKQLGVKIKIKNDVIYLSNHHKLKQVKIIADIYPAFPTDLQQILTVVCLKTNQSYLKDLVYPKRFSHLEEIQKANGIVTIEDDFIKVNYSKLLGNIFTSHDLRCGFACIVLGCMAKGNSYIKRAEIIMRGYENLLQKLQNIGVKINIITL